MDDLNPQQKQAVEHPGGPLLIIAGAGSGKTKTLTSRIARLMAKGTPAAAILAITFTNKAAEEMKSRVMRQMAGNTSSDLPFIGTFHSWGARVLKREAHLLGRTENFSIFDEDDSLRVVKAIVKEMNLDKEKFNPAGFRAKIGDIKNELLHPEDLRAEGGMREKLAADIYEKYEEILKKNNAFDFDDLITKVVVLFIKYPEVLEKYQKKYFHILVDEYQDINTSQYRLIKFLAEKHKNLSVVGDDAQAIYAFRGSDFRIFLNFDSDWPDATIIKLEENYRSTANIISAASNLIKNNALQKPKSLWTQNENGEKITIDGFGAEDDEAYFLTTKILETVRGTQKHGAWNIGQKNTEPQIAILYRTNAQSRAIEQALLQNGIPYRIYGGLKFYDRMEVKDIISALVFASNPENSMAAERLKKNFGKKEAVMLMESLPRLAQKFQPTELINFFLEETKYLEYLEGSYKNYAERIENVNELISFAGTFDQTGLPAFLEQVSLVSSLDTPNGKINTLNGGRTTITLMTIHASKGLEFSHVFVAGASEGFLPHERSISEENGLEEERRLMYVAMTRAKERLFLTFYGIPSRFLYEIPQELTDFKDHVATKRHLTSFEDEDFISYD